MTTMTKLSVEHSKKLDTLSTMSGRIRFLNSINMTRGDISRYLTKYCVEKKIITKDKIVRYQWVRNVLNENVKQPKETF